MKIFYLRDAKRNPVACIATEKVSGGVTFAVSTHNPKDTFCKSMGRTIATGRLLTLITEPNMPVFPLEKGIKGKIMQAVATNKQLPQRTRDAAALWLQSYDPNRGKYNELH